MMSSGLFGQSKFESETRVSLSEVPSQAASYMSSIEKANKVRWYREESQLGITFEAKTRIKDFWYSIEFDSSGFFLDIEKTVHLHDLDQDLVRTIEDGFNTLFKRYRILKVQQQFLISETGFQAFLRAGMDYQHLECIVRGEQKGEIGNFEILLTRDGRVKEVLEVDDRPTDNMEF